LYVPERFVPQRSDEIAARRTVYWSSSAASNQSQLPMLLIGELKEVCPARLGAYARIKHVPDTTFAMAAELYLAVRRRYADELRQWDRSVDLRLLAIATFAVEHQAPVLGAMALMTMDERWVPTCPLGIWQTASDAPVNVQERQAGPSRINVLGRA
jgi:hypothetical protein